VNSPSFSHSSARISAELIEVEVEQYLERLKAPEYRTFLAALYQLALAANNDFTISVNSGTFLRP